MWDTVKPFSNIGKTSILLLESYVCFTSKGSTCKVLLKLHPIHLVIDQVNSQFESIQPAACVRCILAMTAKAKSLLYHYNLTHPN